MRLDSHQHFWRYSGEEYPWIQPRWPIRRDFWPADLKRSLDAVQIDGCIAIQARQSLEENRFLLELADEHQFIKGVVGWVDLRSRKVDEQLTEFAKHPKFVGVRHVAQDEPDDNFLIGRDFIHGISRLHDFQLTYDLLIYPRQLPAAIKLVEKFPDQPVVLDHLAKPPIKSGGISPWREQMLELGRHPNVMCKLSGMVTEADWEAWKKADFRPYLDVAFAAFGPERLMYGSDWPVCLLAATYGQVHGLIRDNLTSLPDTAKHRIMGGNAERFYLHRKTARRAHESACI
jgi:L-fuconolactonase